jgi:hypothetical protein
VNPKVFAILAGDAAVAAFVTAGGVKRIYPVIAPQSAARPYYVWQGVGLSPENYLSGAPDIDYDRVQVHAWSTSHDEAEKMAAAARAALDPHGYLTGGLIDDYDLDVSLYRVGFDWAFVSTR